MTPIEGVKVSDMPFIMVNRYNCISGCHDYERDGLTACNDCVTEWQFYIEEKKE